MPDESVPHKPKPIDSAGVELEDEILQLTELLARNAHDVWAVARMKEGWRWGPKRDDPHKQHPCLVPYDKLPEYEKNYDRTAALETLKTIIALGYRIEKQE